MIATWAPDFANAIEVACPIPMIDLSAYSKSLVSAERLLTSGSASYHCDFILISFLQTLWSYIIIKLCMERRPVRHHVSIQPSRSMIFLC